MDFSSNQFQGNYQQFNDYTMMQQNHKNYDDNPNFYEPLDEYTISSERTSIMTIKRPNYLETLKQKCIDRVSLQRRERIQRYRQNIMLTESKLKSNYIGKQVNNELFQDDFLQQVVNDVYWNSYDPAQDDPQVQSKDDQESIPPLNEEEVQYLMREVNQYLADQLIQDQKQNEEYYYEQYQRQLNEIEPQMLAMSYDPFNNDVYVCALCKNQAFRVHGTKIICERPNCLNLNLETDQFQMESVMNMILKLMNDHQETDCNNHQQQSINDSLKISITKSANMINMLSDDSQEVYQNNIAADNMQDGYYNPMNPQATITQNIEFNSKVALNVNCQCCGYFDFYEIDSCY